MQPMKKYQIIYADPPWRHGFVNRRNISQAAKDNHYPTMKTAEIASLPVKSIAHDNAALFLWTMGSEIPNALGVIKAWGFKYKTVAFTWVKTTTTGKYCFGGGNWTRNNPEMCLLATRGKIKRLDASVRELVISPRREHSRKPDEVRDSIIQLCGDLPRCELFCRYPVDGWNVWGDEVEGEVEWG